MLSDETSRKVFNHLVLYRLLPLPLFTNDAYDPTSPHYYNNEILKTSENEVFLDVGASVGDTILSYINNAGKYSKIYAYELSNQRMEECRSNLKGYENIIFRQVGVGKENGELNFKEYVKDGFLQSDNSDLNLAIKSNTQMPIVKLDDDVDDNVTFIKMDIEGMELDALEGATEILKNNKPKLAISIYHYDTDFWEIPLLIYNINPQYRFYIRHYSKINNLETVLYAVCHGN